MHNYSNREKRNEVMIGGYPYFQITMYQKIWNNTSYFLLKLNLHRLIRLEYEIFYHLF